MKYTVIKNFINKTDASELIAEASKLVNFNNQIIIHKNRSFLSSTSQDFIKLINESNAWNKLEKKINSEEFLNFCFKKIDVNPDNYYLTNFFKKKKLNKFDLLFKKISDLKIKATPTFTMLKYLGYRFFYKSLLRLLKFSNILFWKKKPLELLFDFSRAGNGYNFRIHRDSDSRIVVFLLYLNSIDESQNSRGGELSFHRLIKKDKNLASPDPSSFETIDTIKPEAGTLVIFLNEDDAYHSVKTMENHNSYRYFLYGGFTILSGKNPFIKKSNIKTEFFLYD